MPFAEIEKREKLSEVSGNETGNRPILDDRRINARTVDVRTDRIVMLRADLFGSFVAVVVAEVRKAFDLSVCLGFALVQAELVRIVNHRVGFENRTALVVVIAEMFEAVAARVRCAVAGHDENGLAALAVDLIRESLVIERIELVGFGSHPHVIDPRLPSFESR